jgi:hypothetical protein
MHLTDWENAPNLSVSDGLEGQNSIYLSSLVAISGPKMATLGVGGVLTCVGDHNLQEFNTLFLTRLIQNLQNCYTAPNKT